MNPIRMSGEGLANFATGDIPNTEKSDNNRSALRGNLILVNLNFANLLRQF